jgi:FKBP-type peptidyl-prolyl cis-trans isomerase
MRFAGFLILLVLLSACSGNEDGFEELGEGQFFKLHKFGEHADSIPLKNIREIVLECRDDDNVFRDTLFFRNLSAEALGEGEWVSKFLFLREGDSASFKLLPKYFDANLVGQDNFKNDTLLLNVLISQLRSEEEYLESVKQKMQSGDLKEQVIFLQQEMELRGLSAEFTMYKGGFFKMLKTQEDTIHIGEELCLHYTGTLLDGTVFDKSPEGGLCYTLGQQNQVISGLDMMARRSSDGDSLIIYLPPYLAFGERSVGTIVPPFSMVIYSVGFHKKDTISL